jgi:hypothetical protein
LDPLRGVRSRIHYAAAPAGWAAPWIQPKCRIQLRNSFLFQIYFYKL